MAGSFSNDNDPLATAEALPHVLESSVTEFRAKNVSAIDCIRALGSHFNFHYAIEAVASTEDKTTALDKPITLDIKNSTVSAVLSSIITQDPALQWTLRRDTVVVSPSDNMEHSWLKTPLNGFKVAGLPFTKTFQTMWSVLRAENPSVQIDQPFLNEPQQYGGGVPLFNIEKPGITPEQVFDIFAHRLGCSWVIHTEPFLGHPMRMLRLDNIEAITYTNPDIAIVPDIPHAKFNSEGELINLAAPIKSFSANGATAPECIQLLAANGGFLYGIEKIPVSNPNESEDAKHYIDKKLTFNVDNGEIHDILDSIGNHAWPWTFGVAQNVIQMHSAVTNTDPKYPLGVKIQIADEDRSALETLALIASTVNKQIGKPVLAVGSVPAITDRNGDPLLVRMYTPRLMSVRDLISLLASRVNLSWIAEPQGDKIVVSFVATTAGMHDDKVAITM